MTADDIAALREHISRLRQFDATMHYPAIGKAADAFEQALAALSPAAQVPPREPTASMVNAGAYEEIAAFGSPYDAARVIWRAMYDAALAERGQDQSDAERNTGGCNPCQYGGGLVPAQGSASDPTAPAPPDWAEQQATEI